MRHVARITSACLLCAVVGVLGGAGCPIFDALLNGGLVGFSNAGVRLRIENQSGLKASVLAVYHLGPEEVRRTDRLLPPEGGESTTEVIRTLTDDIMVVAKVANDAALPIGGFIQSGDMLIQAQYRFGLDFFGGETLVLVIPPPDATALLPPPIIDCNHNETPDDLDIQNGTSLDCNENVIPDECEIDMNNNSSFGGPFFCDPAVEDCAADCNENGVPDECDICQEQPETPAITIEGAGFPLPTQITLSPDNAVHEVNTSHGHGLGGRAGRGRIRRFRHIGRAQPQPDRAAGADSGAGCHRCLRQDDLRLRGRRRDRCRHDPGLVSRPSLDESVFKHRHQELGGALVFPRLQRQRHSR
jgi:hypothetical protein